MNVATGHSDDVDADVAALEAVEQAVDQLQGAVPKAILVFTGIDVDTKRALQALAARLPNVPMLGATSAAEASRSLGCAESSVLVVLFAGADLDVGLGVGHLTGEEHGAAAVEAVAQATGALHGPPRLCIMLTAFTKNPSTVLEAVTSALATNDVPVFGGCAACEYGEGIHTEVFFGTETYASGFVVLLLGGRVQHGYAVDSGWTPVGSAHTVTQVLERNLVVQIDGKPALDLYRNYLGMPGGFGAMFVHHPLAVTVEAGTLHRVAYGAGPVPGSLFVDGDLAEGASVRLCEFERESVIASARVAVRKALAAWQGEAPSVALIFECASRRFALGTSMQRAAEAVRDALPPSTRIAGMHALGEFAPLVQGGPCELHNCSIVVLLLGGA